MNKAAFYSVVNILCKYKFSLEDEMVLQQQVHEQLKKGLGTDVLIERGCYLDQENIIDFVIAHTCGDLGIEVKIKGSKKAIYKQVERYCTFDRLFGIILLTSKSMGFPSEINNKPCYVINISKAWL